MSRVSMLCIYLYLLLLFVLVRKIGDESLHFSVNVRLWLHEESRHVHIVDMLILPGNVVIWYCEAFQQPGLFYVVDCYNIIKSVVLINIPKYYWIANKELLNKRIQHYMFVECDQSYF